MLQLEMHMIFVHLAFLLFLDSVSSIESNCNSSQSVSTCFCQVLADIHLGGYSLFNGVVQCRKVENGTADEPFLDPLYCVTAKNNGSSNSDFVAGRCPFTGGFTQKSVLRGEVSRLTDTVCGRFKRSGTLCGRCMNGYAVSLNTYDLRCVHKKNCKNSIWVIHFVIEFIGVTIFFLLLLFLNVQVTAECASASLLLVQIIALPINIIAIRRDWDVVENNNKTSSILSSLVQIFYGIWNLDIPTGIVYPFCVPGNITPLQAFALKYTTSVFPLVLIFISYLLIKMYERNFRIIIFLWKPFRQFWLRFRRRLDSRATIIDVFASFLLLSYTRLSHISFILLSPTKIYTFNNTNRGRGLLYDGSVPYFGEEHRFYGVLAILILVFLVLPPPLLLTFYQFRWFQVFLTRLKFNSHLLGLFIHSFQRGYKDGNNGSRDLRFFSATYFAFRIIAFALYSFVSDYFVLYFCIHGISIVFALLLTILKPFKCDYFNKAEICMSLLIGFISAAAIQNNLGIVFTSPSQVSAWILFISLSVPGVYMVIYIGLWLFKKLYTLNKGKILRQLENPLNEVEDDPTENLVNPTTGSRVRRFIENAIISNSPSTLVPDRLSNPSMYSDLEYEWFPEEQYTDTDTQTVTETTTNASTGATGSTHPRSTYTDRNTVSSIPTNSTNPPTQQRVKNTRPLSLHSIKLGELSHKLGHTQHNTS